MRHFRIETRIAAPPERVWAVISDFARWPEWTPTVTSIRILNPGPLRPGLKVLIRQPKLPPALWSLNKVKEGCCFQWVTRGPGISVVARHCVEPTGRGTRVVLSLEFNGFLGGVIGRLTRSLNNRYLALEAEGLKRRCESPA